MKEIISIFGTGIGEEVKGVTTQKCVQETNAHTVIRSGGFQSGHHIVDNNGETFSFSHFSCGTFDGAQTYLKNMVFNPVDLFEEAIMLEEKGIENIFDKIIIDENCISTTPYHQAISRLREVLLGDNKKGTVGKGVGDAIKDSSDPNLTLRAADFFQNFDFLQNKIKNIQQHKLYQSQKLLENKNPSEISDRALFEFSIIKDKNLIKKTVIACQSLSKLVRITDQIFFQELLNKNGTIVCEPSHGALLHPDFGFVPHVTQVDPTGQDLLESIKNQNYDGKIVRLGVSRCYITRHGAGPLVSFNQEMTDSIIESSDNNGANEWLGPFRNGNFDLVAMKYALNFSGSISGLGISYLDILNQNQNWQVCESYQYLGDKNNLQDFFEIEDNKIIAIKIYKGVNKSDQINHQVQLTNLLKNCHPILTTLKSTDNKNLEEIFINYVEQKLEIPVVLVGYGPKSSDRKFRINLSDLG
ncbi:MAG: adenylosuccinate synthetase [Candidatus Shapirobacteria bacterium]|jgi:adenylosuccinate synthase